MPPQRPLLALGLRVSGAVAIATMFMLVKLASETGVALPETMFWRQATSIPIIIAWLAGSGRLRSLRTHRIGSHARRGLIGMVGMFCNFSSVSLLPLAASTTLGFTAPLFAVLITGLVLRERVGPWRWTAVLAGFLGVIVIAQPGSVPIPLLGAIAGLTAGFLTAIISFLIRDLGKTESASSVVFWFAVTGTLVTALLLPFTMTAHTGFQWLLLIGVGVSGTVGQLLLTAALRIGSVATVIVMDYTMLIWASLFGWLIWDSIPPYATWLGAPLIILAGIVIAWREHRLAKSFITPTADAIQGPEPISPMEKTP